MNSSFVKLGYITHRHYVGSLYFHEERRVYMGTIQLLPISIPFYGNSYNEAIKDFKDKVNAYLKTFRVDPNRRIGIN